MFRLQLLFTVAACVCTVLVQSTVLHGREQRIMGGAVAVYLLSQAPSRTLRSVFRSFERTRYETFTTVAEKVAALAVAVAAAACHLPLTVLALGLACVGTINVLGLIFVCRARFVDILKVGDLFKSSRVILIAAAPLGVSTMFSVINLRVGTVILEHYRSVVEVGLFGVAQRLITPLAYIVITLQAALLPVLARRVANEYQMAREVLQWVLQWILVVALLLVAIIEQWGRPIIALFFGTDYLPAVPVLRLLMISVPFTFLINTASLSLFLTRKYRAFVVAWGCSSAVTIASNLLLVPRYGEAGVAYGIILSEAALLLATMWLGREFLGIRMVASVALAMGIFAAVMLAAPTVWKLPVLLLALGCSLPRQSKKFLRWLQTEGEKQQLQQLYSAEVTSVAG